MMHQEIARPLKSPWASPLDLVPKNDNGLQPCGDYRALNARTVSNRYSVPHVENFTRTVHGCKVFTTVDLVRACNRIPVAPEDVEKTAITIFRFSKFLSSFYSRRGENSAAVKFQLRGSKRNNAPIEWYNELERVFNGLKNALANAAMLAHPIMGAPLSISVEWFRLCDWSTSIAVR